MAEYQNGQSQVGLITGASKGLGSTLASFLAAQGYDLVNNASSLGPLPMPKEIAAELVIAERTVKFHISSIFGKLGAGNRTEAVTTAIQQGLVVL